MEQSDIAVDFEVILERLNYFFTDSQFTIESVQKDLQNRRVVSSPKDFITYLQTALLDEKLVEVRFNDSENLYFTKIIDSPQDDSSPEDDNSSTPAVGKSATISNQSARYISNLTHITTLPLEPGMGNYHIRNSQKVIMRIFTKSFAFEFGTYYRGISSSDSVPALDFDFPVIGRLLLGKREYRAKVTSGIDLRVTVTGKRKQPDLHTQVIDISASGMAILLGRRDANHFFKGEYRKFSITEGDKPFMDVNGKVIHVTAVRKHYGVTYICGIQLDLVTRDSIAKVESLVAKVQRIHLQSISGLSRETGFKLIV